MPATRAWDESKPAGTDYVSAGDDEIRATKVDIRERLAIEHIWGVNVTDDGLHKDGSARIQSGTDAGKPTSPKLNQLYYATDTFKLYHCRTAGTWTDITVEFTGFVRTTGDQTIAGVKTFSSIPVFSAGITLGGNANFAQQQAISLVIENRTTDPSSPVAGQIWFRTDI